MKFLLSFALLISCTSVYAQPTPEWFLYPDSPFDTRFDDVFFVNDTVGWAVNTSGQIYKTINGTQHWELQDAFPTYFRSVEFFDENVGFAGSLFGQLFKTENGGDTWNDISALLPIDIEGICGMSTADDSTIYACGIWHGPAFVYKSSDRGVNWQFFDMSAYATNLVDIHFTDALHGFVTGTDIENELGGVILYTEDGGLSWEKKVNSEYPNEYVWKIQVLDSLYVYASIEDNSATNDPAILISEDGGMTWEKNTFADEYYNVEMVGFINRDTGWVGGWFEGAFETFDGGETWNMNFFGNNLNRFFKMNDNLAYASGETIYVYSDTTYVIPVDTTQDTIIDTTITILPLMVFPHVLLEIFPNPSMDHISLTYSIGKYTFIDLSIFDLNGRRVHTFHHNPIQPGNYTSHFKHQLPPGNYVITMHSHEGVIWKKFVVQ